MMKRLTFSFLLSLSFLITQAQFEVIDTTFLHAGYFAIDCQFGDCLFVGNGKIAHSYDAGQTMIEMTSPVDYVNEYMRECKIVGPGQYYVAKYVYFDPYNSFVLSYTSDYGQTWDSVFTNGGYAVFDTIRAFGFEINGTELGVINTDANKMITTADHFETLDTIVAPGYATDFKYNDLLLGVADSNLAISNDSGRNWSLKPIPNSITLSSAVSVNPSTVLVLDHDYNSFNEKYVHVSQNLGETWKRFYLGPKELEIFSKIEFLNDSFGIAVGSYANRPIVTWTEDQGQHWDTLRIPTNHYSYDIEIVSGSTALLAMPNGLLLKLNLNELPEPSFLSVEETPNAEFKVYPNPVQQTLHLELKHPEEINLQCFSLEGRSIFKKSYSNSSFIDIDVSDLEVGLYILSIESESASEVFRFVKD